MAATILNREEKIKNAICFFAWEHERLTRKLLTHTFLYKYLAFLDYASMEKTGRPALGLLYRTRGRGPLPIGAYGRQEKLKNDCFTFLPQGKGRYMVRATGKPDLGCFSPLELSEMKSLVETYAHRFAKACDTGEASRRATGFWKRTRGIGTSAGVGYDDVFGDDFFTTQKETCTMSSLHVLIEKYVARTKELETRMADTRRKLKIVTEATRLLVEEGLSDEYLPDRSGEDRTYQRDRNK
jgi:hypothetical protein